MFRLVKDSSHDTFNRDTALVYINGEIYKANTHAEAINNYLKDKNLDHSKGNNSNRSYYYNVIYHRDIENSSACAHLVNSERSIFIELETLVNADLQTVIEAFKKEYPNYDIYDDDSALDEEGYPNVDADLEEYKKIGVEMMSRLIKQAKPRTKKKEIQMTVKFVFEVFNDNEDEAKLDVKRFKQWMKDKFTEWDASVLEYFLYGYNLLQEDDSKYALDIHIDKILKDDSATLDERIREQKIFDQESEDNEETLENMELEILEDRRPSNTNGIAYEDRELK
jgi:hypothetical protein